MHNLEIRARPIVIWMLLAAAPLTGAALAAQHDSAGAIEEGRNIYGSVCANCHGPDGNQIPGIDFSRGQYRRSYSDAELNDIIRKGIPGTPMPPTNMSEVQAARIVSYLRSLSAALRSDPVAGDPVRGRSVFEGKGACSTCHAVEGRGSRVGPDLSTIGSLRRSAELEASIVEPAAEVLPQNRSFRVTTRDGRTVTGRLLNQDTFTVQLLDSEERLQSFEKSALREYAFTDTTMPSYRGKLTAQELADLVSYLASLRRR
jgi:putative heme-binding domain-containing protein